MRAKFQAIVILAASTLTQVVNAADGTINFTGTLLNTACTVDPGSASQTVSLGNISKSAFTVPGGAAGSQVFKITVRDCDPSISRIATRFDGTPHRWALRMIGLTPGPDTAIAVGIMIYEQDGTTEVRLGNKSVGTFSQSGANSADLSYVVKYMAAGWPTSIVAGRADATVTFTMDYN